MGWYTLRIRGELPDIALNRMVVREVVGVGFLTVQIPFGSEDAAPPYAFKALSKPADAGKKVDEGEPSWTVRDTFGSCLL